MKFNVPIILILSAVVNLSADVFYLKNNRRSEGNIIREDSVSFIIDVGIGTSKIKKADIDSLHRSSDLDKKILQEKWVNRYSSDSRYIPDRCKKLGEKLAELEAIRIQARDKTSRIALKEVEISKKVREIAELTDEYLKLSEQIKVMEYYDNPRLYREQNNKITNLRNDINISYDQLAVLRGQIDTTNPDLALYAQLHGDFSILLEQEKNKFSADKNAKKEHAYLQKVNARVAEFSQDFSSAEVAYTFTPAKHAIISAVINEKVAGRFLFDTGASTVTLSRALAEKLKIVVEGLPVQKASLANGEIIDSRPVILKSMKVDKFTIKNVQAIILDRQPEPGVDGLLGMSFLKNFLIHFDPSTNKLVFKEISF